MSSHFLALRCKPRLLPQCAYRSDVLSHYVRLTDKHYVMLMLMLMLMFVTRLNSRWSRIANIYYGKSKRRWYRCVLNCDRNEPTLDAARIVAGRLFQTLCAAIEKRRDEVLVLERGPDSMSRDDSALVYTARAAMISKSALQVCSI